MKVKTSVTLSPELLAAIDHQCGAGGTRSDFLEKAAWEVIRSRQRQARDERDKRIYSEHADEYNRQALESLELQDDAW